MPFSMIHNDGAFKPAAVCDHCGQEAGADGFVAWNLEATPDELRREPALIACSDECLGMLEQERAGTGDWVATPLDAFLAFLVDEMKIDVRTVFERERANWAAVHTRDQAPD